LTIYRVGIFFKLAYYCAMFIGFIIVVVFLLLGVIAFIYLQKEDN